MSAVQLDDRVLARITSRISITEAGCWLWPGAATRPGPDGYGMIRVGGKLGKTLLTHRVAYEILVGPIPEGLDLDHLCRVRRCCNPAHLEPVSRSENALRGAAHGTYGKAERAKTQCPQGHPYAGANLYVNPTTGKRKCRECQGNRAAA